MANKFGGSDLYVAVFVREWQIITERVKNAAKKRGVNLADVPIVAKEKE